MIRSPVVDGGRPAAGVDGCRRGWVVAGGRDPGDWSILVVDRFADVVDQVESGQLAAVAVDVPIGLADQGRRACDVEARRLIGPRRSSLFPAPARAVLGAATYQEACERSRTASGRSVSRQTYGLVGKIAEVDRCMRPDLQPAIGEAHPEGSFTELAGHPCRWPKRSPEGLSERASLLVPFFGRVPDRVPGAAIDDVYDALVLLWTAWRLAAGCAKRVGDGAIDRRRLRMEIWR